MKQQHFEQPAQQATLIDYLHEVAHMAGRIEQRELVSLWSCVDDIAAFAGEDMALAKYYDFDDEFLVGHANCAQCRRGVS